MVASASPTLRSPRKIIGRIVSRGGLRKPSQSTSRALGFIAAPVMTDGLLIQHTLSWMEGARQTASG